MDKRLFPFLLGVLLLSATAASQECGENLFKMPARLQADAGRHFTYDINATENDSSVFFSFVPVNMSIRSLELDKESGLLTLNASDLEAGHHSLLIVVTTPDGCYDVKQLEILIYDRPSIVSRLPDLDAVRIEENSETIFFINATTSQGSAGLSYEWYYDDKKMKGSLNSYLLSTNFSDAGMHVLQAVIRDKRNLTTANAWQVEVINKNRRPYVRAKLPSLVIADSAQGKIMNLHNYIYDPDGDQIDFKIQFFEMNDEILKDDSLIFNIIIDKDGDFNLYKKSNLFYRQYVVINATDSSGASIMTDPFTLRLAVEEDKAEFLLSPGKRENCTVAITCGEWSECLPTGIKARECSDRNRCNPSNTTIMESQQCYYNESCFDRIINQDETDIDCGGSCEACPSCTDKLLNQGEENIDCGGPCGPCPTCSDKVKNQDETDIDCGGICSSCNDYRECTVHTDCQSMVCQEGFCRQATCSDYRLNQGEENTDCGGPCNPCPSCHDGVQNQGEENTDCGGPCKKCQTCSDGMRNQKELFTDCGGPCEPCRIVSFIISVRNYLLVLIPLLVIIVSFLIIKRNYEHDKLGFYQDYSRIFSFLPSSLPENHEAIIISAISRFQELKQELFTIDDTQKLSADYGSAVSDFFKGLFDIDGSITRGSLEQILKAKLRNPFLAGYFLEFYIEAMTYSPESPLFKIELNEKIETDIRILIRARDLL